MASRPDPRRDRALLVAWIAASFGLSALTDLRALATAGAVALLVCRRGAAASLRRVLVAVLPLTAGLSLASFGLLRVSTGAWPPAEPFAALVVRSSLLAFLAFSVLARVALLAALAPFPTLTRLAVVTLAQIHALRLLATESLLALRSRLPRRPGAVDVVRGAGGITGTLFTLAARNARDVSDAMRSRGFS